MKIYLRDQNTKAEVYRKEGKMPGVLYGPNLESKPIYAEEKEFYKTYKEHETGFFEFEFENEKFLGLFREVQVHPLTYKIIHFDLYVPSLEREVETEVPLEFIGESPVLKKGGVLNFNLHEIPLSALPKNLPEKIVVDLSKLEEIGQSIYIKDLDLPKDVKVLIDENTVVVTALKETATEEGVETTT